MLNKNGQTLVLFIIIIPLLLVLVAFIVDFGLINNEKIKTKNTIKNAITAVIKDDTDDNAKKNQIIKILNENKINIDNIQIVISDNQITITNTYEIDAVFGNIIGRKNYEIKTEIIGELVNDEIIFK